jgi:hypothetical protein
VPAACFSCRCAACGRRGRHHSAHVCCSPQAQQACWQRTANNRYQPRSRLLPQLHGQHRYAAGNVRVCGADTTHWLLDKCHQGLLPEAAVSELDMQLQGSVRCQIKPCSTLMWSDGSVLPMCLAVMTLLDLPASLCGPAAGAAPGGLAGPSQGNLLDWADKALGQGISTVTRRCMAYQWLFPVLFGVICPSS